MPRRMIARTYGGPAALELIDDPAKPLGDASVRIAVRSSGTNPADYKSLLGMYGRDESKLPLRPGSEVSGVVTEAGPESGFAVGDEVIARSIGGYAEEVTVAAKNVFLKPASLDWDAAAGLLAVGTTAWHLLEATHVASGDGVIVHGASGAVGSLAVQLAVARGARVVGTASPANHELLRGWGAEPVTYGDGLVDRLRVAFPEGADVALDTVGSDEAIRSSLELVAGPSRIATIANFDLTLGPDILRLGSGAGADPGTELRNAARQPLIDLAASGSIEVRIGAVFPLEQAAAALDLLRSGHPGGKVLLHP